MSVTVIRHLKMPTLLVMLLVYGGLKIERLGRRGPTNQPWLFSMTMDVVSLPAAANNNKEMIMQLAQ